MFAKSIPPGKPPNPDLLHLNLHPGPPGILKDLAKNARYT